MKEVLFVAELEITQIRLKPEIKYFLAKKVLLIAEIIASIIPIKNYTNPIQ